ncbi:acyl-CoA dehydrogenase family protein [Monashia sp. NPDC004114]
MTELATYPAVSDFYGFEGLLTTDERAMIQRVRTALDEHARPLLTEHWSKATFPHELVPVIAGLGANGWPYEAPGCAGGRFLMDGILAMEFARVDCSLATFRGVHSGLAMGSIDLCGDDEQRRRWLPAMARMDLIGAFGLTEPDVGSGAAGGLTTTARRDGETWVLNGAKRWIGNATFADLVVIWARDEADGQVKGFVVEKGTPGFTTTKIAHKLALRIVQNADITLTDVRVPESNRLQKASSFKDTARVLLMTRAGVAWMAVGCMLGAYEHSLAYAMERQQFGRPIAGFQLVQDLLVRQLGNITASAAMCVRLSQLQDEGLATDAKASLAKAYCTQRMRESVGWARELMGGNGILIDRNVGRFVGDAEAIYSYEGTREMNTLIVGREITGLSAFV